MSVQGRGGPGLAWDPDWQVPGSPAGAARVTGSTGLLAGLAEPAAAVHGWLPEPRGRPKQVCRFLRESLLRFQQVRSQKPYLGPAPRTPAPGPLDRCTQARCQREGSARPLEGPLPELCLLCLQPHCDVWTSRLET